VRTGPHWGRGVRGEGHLPPSAWLLLLAFVALYQWLLLSNFDFRLFAPESLDGTFNSILLHLLHGSAEIAPSAIGFESFTRNGHTYAYFGIVPALLRLPALPFASDPAHMHLSRLSCVAGATALVGLTLRLLLAAHRSLPPAQRNRTLLLCSTAAFTLGGPQLFAANAGYVYNEPEIWGAVLVAGFTLIAARPVLADRGLSGAELIWLGALAGLAINTRPSAGVDLFTGLGLIMATLIVARLRGRPDLLSWRATAVAATLAAAGLAIAGLMNTAHFGNPLQFSDFNYQDIMYRYPHRIAMYRLYGAFNLQRIPAALLYYTTGLTVLLKHAAPFTAWLGDHFDGIEGPPSSPLLTNPLWTGMAVIGVAPALRRSALTAATLAGHALAALLLMCAMFMALRYRIDLTGLMVLPAIFGYIAVSKWLAGVTGRARTGLNAAIVALCVMGIVCALYVLVMAKILNLWAPVAVRCELQHIAPFLDVTSPQALPPGCHGPR
jgi:hypothetical protein